MKKSLKLAARQALATLLAVARAGETGEAVQQEELDSAVSALREALQEDTAPAELRAALATPATRTLVPLARNRTALINLPTTIAALETVDRLITYYRDCRPEVIEVRFERGSSLDVIQLDRDMALELLTHKRQSLVDYLASLGIAA